MNSVQRIVAPVAQCVVVASLIGIAAVPAVAQDAKVQVRSAHDGAHDVVLDVMQIVHDAVGSNLGRDIADIVRDATGAGSSFHSGLVRGAEQNADFKVQREQRETKTLTLGASGSLELKNISGDIVVAAGSGTEASVEIVRVSHGRTDADAAAGLQRVTVDVTQVGDRATVQTHYPDDRRPAYSVRVEYHVKAPAGTRLTVSSIGGGITVNDIRGETSASTTGGSITVTHGHVASAHSVGGNVTLTGTDSDGTLEVETMGGQIVLNQIKARRLQAGTVGGNVSVHDATCDAADVSSTGGNVEFAGPLVKNGRYEFHSIDGTVRFTPTGNVGYELQASTFVGEIRTDGVSLQVQGAVSGRGLNHSLRGTVGDGSALAILRTLSGNIVIGGRKQ